MTLKNSEKTHTSPLISPTRSHLSQMRKQMTCQSYPLKLLDGPQLTDLLNGMPRSCQGPRLLLGNSCLPSRAPD